MSVETEDYVIIKLPNIFQTLLLNYLKKRFETSLISLTESTKQTQLFKVSIEKQEEILVSIGKFFAIYAKSSYFQSKIEEVAYLDVPSFIWFWYKSCNIKKAYQTEESSKWFNEHLGGLWGVDYRAYHCDFCNKYHLTTVKD
jgi:hypothetical protein